MMTLSSYISFVILVFVMVYSPGPMTMFMMANGMKAQHRSVWPILVGANNAYLLSIIVFTLGLNDLLQKNIFIFKGVQIFGIIYLLYLAYTQWNKKIIHAVPSEITAPKESSLYLKGALIALSNPKTIILFGIIFPQFIVAGKYRLLQIGLLGLTFLILQFASGFTYAYFGQRIKNLVVNPFYQHLVNRISASVLVLVAGFLIVKLY